MRPERNEDLSIELREQLGDDAFLRLVEAFGGERLYISATGDTVRLVEAIGEVAAGKLSTMHGGNRLNVPLARELRARHYRAAGLGDVEIARKLGITVSGLERLFQRMPDRPAKRRGKFVDPRQMHLFEG